MPKLVQCIPNFSAGDEKTGQAIAEAIDRAGDARALDVHWDPDHARTVVTFAGSPESVKAGILAGAAQAVLLVDLRNHKGEHPRLGAVDVVPFVPLSDMTMENCVELSYSVGGELAHNLGLPIYYYERSARRADRANLSKVRQIGFEALRDIELAGYWEPDEGPKALHPSAGACVVGARGPLIAFNVNLDSQDLSVAKKIAARLRDVRDSGEGMSGVKALGLNLPHSGCVQVSTNITLPNEVTMCDVMSFVEREAAELGVAIKEPELVGMVRLKHLLAATEKCPSLKQAVRPEAVLDYRIPDLPPP